MSENGQLKSNKVLTMAVLVGVFVWIVLESIFWGAVAGGATHWLMRRDADDESMNE